ncbi:MAG: cytochrome c oxidase accessory protein CcoG [Planctomycetes bacterium]|nr:cytochrome c oxidase accessory protein CcoG [Planctomycetota bacterium]
MSTEVKRGIRRTPDLDSLYSINDDGSRNMLQPADVRGRWHTRKNIVFAVLIAIYVVVPWIRIGGFPAIRLDVPARTAYLVGHTYTREDFYLVFFLLTGFAFGLFAVTALWGRIWCGYACPQTVFLEGVYRRIEGWIEGSRNERLRRNQGPMSFDKLWRKVLKQLCFLVVTLLITHTLLAYFLPVDELLPAILAGPSKHWLAFSWTLALTAIIYFDFAWFREQFCVIMCPYGRLQSALIDDDTVLVGYDHTRGEPRGAKGKAEGDCIDCRSCVNVCPTGIDIRNGLQMECIGCTNCVDACDSIMQQIGRPEGLVRYDSYRGFRGEKRRFVRPRLFLYAILALVGLAVFSFTASKRTSFEVTILRARGMPYTIENERIQNLFTIHLQNKSPKTAEYTLAPAEPTSGQPAIEWKLSSTELEIESLGEVKIPIFAFVPRAEFKQPIPCRLLVTDKTTGESQTIELHFQGP